MKEKRKELEALGWKFQRRNSKRKWVPAGSSRVVDKAIALAWEQQKAPPA